MRQTLVLLGVAAFLGGCGDDSTTTPDLTVGPDLAPQCRANSDCATSPGGKACDTAAGICVKCVADTDCSGETPKCDKKARECVGCLADADCGQGKLCASTKCAVGCSATHKECPTGQVCNVLAGACVGCLGDSDCKEASAPRCDSRTATCVACLVDNDNCAMGMRCSGNMCVAGCKDNKDCSGATPQCDTATKMCVQCVSDSGCSFGQVCKSNMCTSGCSPQQACPGGQGCCSGSCITLASDPANCGTCGNACAKGAGCCGGACVPLNTITNCGACGVACGPNSDCCSGACTSINTVKNCGECGAACTAPANGAAACKAGACAIDKCTSEFRDCNTSYADGCEIDTASDPKNCGGCGKPCTVANGTAGCAASACTVASCVKDFGDCDKSAANGCESNTTTDPKNCGGCGKPCTAGYGCVASACVPPASCAQALENAPGSKNGIYKIDPDGAGAISPYDVYCDMETEGGGWTLVMGIVPTDGNAVDWFNENFWLYAATQGGIDERFTKDFKSPAASQVKGTKLMFQVAKGSAQGDVTGYRGWQLTGKYSLMQMTNLSRNTAVSNSELFANLDSVYTWEPILKFGNQLIVNRVDNANGDAVRFGVNPRPYYGDDNQPGLGTAMNLDCCGDCHRHSDVELQWNTNDNIWCEGVGEGRYKWLGSDSWCGGPRNGSCSCYCQNNASPGYTPIWNYRIFIK